MVKPRNSSKVQLSRLRIEYREVQELVPYARNARLHSDDQIAQLAGSIREFGWTQPVLVDRENGIIAGHARVMAARRLGLKSVPVIELSHLTDAQRRAYVLADNQLATHATWDVEMMTVEMKELQGLKFDLSLIGFGQDEVKRLLMQAPAVSPVDPDDVPAPPDEPLTRMGDLYIMGNHRLLCGDSGSKADLDRLLDGERVHLLNTDPPYNVKVEPRSNNAMAAGTTSFAAPKGGLTHNQDFDLARRGRKGKTNTHLRPKDLPLANDFLTDEEFDKRLDAWFGNAARVMQPGAAFYIWGGYANCANYPPALKRHGLYFSQAVIWVKEHPVLSRKDFMGNHEWCFYGWREGGGHRFFGPPNVPDVWSVKKINPAQMVHLTEKPSELARRAIEYSSQPGENVLDLFGGSGSTMMAAEQTGRRSFTMELSPLYADVIVHRWERFTGKRAKRIRAGTRTKKTSAHAEV